MPSKKISHVNDHMTQLDTILGMMVPPAVPFSSTTKLPWRQDSHSCPALTFNAVPRAILIDSSRVISLINTVFFPTSASRVHFTSINLTLDELLRRHWADRIYMDPVEICSTRKLTTMPFLIPDSPPTSSPSGPPSPGHPSTHQP